LTQRLIKQSDGNMRLITPSRADPYKHTIVGPIGFSRSQIDNAIWHGSSGYTHIVYYPEEMDPYVVG